jgi:hypothetical protein
MFKYALNVIIFGDFTMSVLFSLNKQDVQLPRLIGAFIIVAALLMFVRAGAQMFDSWDAVKDARQCFEEVGENPAYTSVSECREMAQDLGLYVKFSQFELTKRQFWSALLQPIATLLLWAGALLFGLIIYRANFVPIKAVRPVKTARKPAKKK